MGYSKIGKVFLFFSDVIIFLVEVYSFLILIIYFNGLFYSQKIVRLELQVVNKWLLRELKLV